MPDSCASRIFASGCRPTATNGHNHGMTFAHRVFDGGAEHPLLGDDEPGAQLGLGGEHRGNGAEVERGDEVVRASPPGHIDGETVCVVESRLPRVVLDLQVERHGHASSTDSRSGGFTPPPRSTRRRSSHGVSAMTMSPSTGSWLSIRTPSTLRRTSTSTMPHTEPAATIPRASCRGTPAGAHDDRLSMVPAWRSFGRFVKEPLAAHHSTVRVPATKISQVLPFTMACEISHNHPPGVLPRAHAHPRLVVDRMASRSPPVVILSRASSSPSAPPGRPSTR